VHQTASSTPASSPGFFEMTTAAMPKRQQETESEEYRQRMVVNALAASFITLMIVSGYWIVNTLVQVS
jgi:hypothetical protein